MTRMLAATGIGEGRGVERAGLALLVFVCAAGALQPFYAVRLQVEKFEKKYVAHASPRMEKFGDPPFAGGDPPPKSQGRLGSSPNFRMPTTWIGCNVHGRLSYYGQFS